MGTEVVGGKMLFLKKNRSKVRGEGLVPEWVDLNMVAGQWTRCAVCQERSMLGARRSISFSRDCNDCTLACRYWCLVVADRF